MPVSDSMIESVLRIRRLLCSSIIDTHRDFFSIENKEASLKT